MSGTTTRRGAPGMVGAGGSRAVLVEGQALAGARGARALGGDRSVVDPSETTADLLGGAGRWWRVEAARGALDGGGVFGSAFDY